jgi:hypoxanthine-guanine phosphoribosyltransferase
VPIEVDTRKALDIICELAATYCNASVCCVVLCNEKAGGHVLGAKGSNARKLAGKVRIEQLNEDSRPIVIFRDINLEPWFSSHALNSIIPNPRNLIALSIPFLGPDVAYLVVLNSGIAETKIDVGNMSKLANLASSIISTASLPPLATSSLDSFAEDAPRVLPVPAIGTDAIVAFLARTLPKHPTLKVRDGIAYTVVRRWRSQLKETQVAAIQALKISNDSVTAELAATEIVETVSKLFAGMKFDTVVPIPGGSSGMINSLSFQIGERVATKIKVPFLNCLESKTDIGSSHPKKSLKLKPYTVLGKISGTVLLVDDIATTGTHLQKAHLALTNHGVAVFAIAWIGS